MIRSCRIPPVLNRICDGDKILAALLVSYDGELLGTSGKDDEESFATLIADTAMDYVKLGHEFAMLLIENEHVSPHSQFQSLLLEFEQKLVGVAHCGADCLVVAVAAPDTPPGFVQTHLQALASFVQEQLSSLLLAGTAAAQRTNHSNATTTSTSSVSGGLSPSSTT